MNEVTRIATAPRAKTETKQDYGTPKDFLSAVERRFGPLAIDLACTRENAVTNTGFYYPEVDSLQQDWAALGRVNLWLNPPFKNIEPWAAKLAAECQWRQGLALFLTPASIGTDWFLQHVRGKAMVLGLTPRMTFEGTPINPKTGKVDPYPKDLMLSVYGFGLHGFDTWRWKP
jgi:phage N-6-adenine-methyltransferase